MEFEISEPGEKIVTVGVGIAIISLFLPWAHTAWGAEIGAFSGEDNPIGPGIIMASIITMAIIGFRKWNLVDKIVTGFCGFFFLSLGYHWPNELAEERLVTSGDGATVALLAGIVVFIGIGYNFFHRNFVD